jgi:hypothetical protein
MRPEGSLTACKERASKKELPKILSYAEKADGNK